jgi:branched-chain amino acid transport system permease protein
MDNLLFVALNGSSLGAIYALLAIGFVVVFRATGVFNFAQAALIMLGTYAMVRFGEATEAPFLLVVAFGVAVAVVAALAADRLLVRRAASKSVLGAIIMTLAIDLVLQTEITRRIGPRIAFVQAPWGTNVVSVFGVSLPVSRIAAFVAVAVMVIGFAAWSKRSRWGLAFRAAADRPTTAALMGISLRRVSMIAWGVGGSFAALGGLFLTAYPSPGLGATTGLVAFGALPAAIIGGLDSVSGAVLGGLIVGLATTAAQVYAGSLPFLGSGFHAVTPFAVMLVVLLVKPSGIFGSNEVTRA